MYIINFFVVLTFLNIPLKFDDKKIISKFIPFFKDSLGGTEEKSEDAPEIRELCRKIGRDEYFFSVSLFICLCGVYIRCSQNCGLVMVRFFMRTAECFFTQATVEI